MIAERAADLIRFGWPYISEYGKISNAYNEIGATSDNHGFYDDDDYDGDHNYYRRSLIEEAAIYNWTNRNGISDHDHNMWKDVMAVG